MLKKILLFFVLLVLAPLLCGVTYEGLDYLADHAGTFLTSPFSLGFVLYVMLSFFLGGPLITFLEHLQHEMAHGAVSLVFAHRLHKMVVAPNEGSSMTTLGRPNALIALAPYYLPLATIPLLIIRPTVPKPGHGFLDFLIGLTLAFHLVGLFRSFNRRQTDITNFGMLFALGLTATLNVVVLMVIATILSGRYEGLGPCLQDMAARVIEFYGAAISALRQSGVSGSP